MITNITTSGHNAPTALQAVDFESIISRFISEYDIKPSSLSLYRRQLAMFFTWVSTSGRTLSTLTPADVKAYKQDLTEKGLSTLTIGSYLTSLRAFYQWAESNSFAPNITKGVKTPTRKKGFIKQHLTGDMAADLLHHFEEKSLRDYAITHLALRTGLRTIEIVRANIEDIRLETYEGGTRRVLHVWGKGKDDRADFVVLTEKAWQPIAHYLATRKGAKGTEPLFTSDSHRNAGERLTTRTISGLIKEGLRAIGIDDKAYTAHSLRHTTAVTILKAGGSITDAQGVLRHSNPATTQIYLESIKREMRLSTATEQLLDNAF